jgi:protein-S-isoprenylcysteine O-methyltransferase Ste14
VSEIKACGRSANRVGGNTSERFQEAVASRALAWAETLALFAGLYGGTPLLGIGLDRILRWPAIPDPLRVLGPLPLAVGGLDLGWCFALFVRIGKGTPNPWLPPIVLVTEGPFAWTRNPIVMGHALAVLGEAILLGSSGTVLIVLLLAIPVRMISPREERTLELRFGDAYRRYREAVPRWIPRIRRHDR